MPSQIVAGNVYAVTQGTGAYSVNESLAQNLTRQAWAEAVSPEVLGLGTLLGTPVVVRGANMTLFLRLEEASWTEGGASVMGWAAAGEGLRSRLGLTLGQSIALEGSSAPRLAVARITGFYRADSVANDELVVDMPLARFLTGVIPGIYHSIRVKTTEPSALLAFLTSTGASVHVTGPGGILLDANTGPATDARVINLFLLYGEGTPPANYLAEAINEATASVRVASVGVLVLIGLLVATGIHAVQARAFADRRASLGVLRAIGAGGTWVRVRIVAETIPIAALAAVAGTGTGLVAATLLAPPSSVLAFGHEVRAAFDPLASGLLIAFVLGASVVSQLRLVGRAMKERPGESIREAVATEPSISLEVVLRD